MRLYFCLNMTEYGNKPIQKKYRWLLKDSTTQYFMIYEDGDRHVFLHEYITLYFLLTIQVHHEIIKIQTQTVLASK